ncbi:hypothetical protein LXL04_009866 [Taraxacum kok-saghyz]
MGYLPTNLEKSQQGYRPIIDPAMWNSSLSNYLFSLIQQQQLFQTFSPPPPSQSQQQFQAQPEPQQPNVIPNDDKVEQRKGRTLTKKWTHEEEKILAERIIAHFCERINKPPNYHTHNQCNSNWSNMNNVVVQFNGIYINYYNQPLRSGENEA